MSHLERCVCVFEGFNVYIYNFWTNPRVLPWTLFCTSVTSVMWYYQLVRKTLLNIWKLFRCGVHFSNHRNFNCCEKCLFLCTVYVKKFYFKKIWSLMSIIKLLLDEATLSRMRKIIWEVHIYHCYIKIYILIIFAGCASKLTYLFILDQRHWKVEFVSIVSVKMQFEMCCYVTMNVPQETSVL